MRVKKRGPKADELAFAVEGPGVTPKSVDPAEFFNLAASFFDLIRKIGDPGSKLSLEGVRIFQGSAASASVVSDIPEAAARGERLRRCIEGSEIAPSGVVVPLDAFRRRLLALGPIRQASYQAGNELASARLTPRTTAAPSVTEIIEARALILGVNGGNERSARVAVHGEPRTFRIELSKAEVCLFGARIDHSVDLVVRVTRTEAGVIDSGVLVEAPRFVEKKDDELETLRAWFKPAADEWAQVEDIDGELRRERVGHSSH